MDKTVITPGSNFLSFRQEKAIKKRLIYSMCLKKARKATFGKTLGACGNIKITPWIVEIAPITQKIIIGKVRGVLNVIFLLKRRNSHRARTTITAKSSALIYTQVFLISTKGSFGYSGINIKRKRVHT